MCNIYSGHIVSGKTKHWGKVLFHTGIHHEIDREIILKGKYKNEQLVAWETENPMDISSVTFTHSCGIDIPTKEKKELKILVLDWMKANENMMLDKIKTKENSEYLAVYCSAHFDKWFDKELFDWDYSRSLAEYCSAHFDKWFDKELFDWNDSEYLAEYCSEHFDKWFDRELFDWDYSRYLAEYCSDKKHIWGN